MNLVERRESLIKELEQVTEQKNKILEQLKQAEIAIERYNGAIINMNVLIKEEEEVAKSDKGDLPEKETLKIVKE